MEKCVHVCILAFLSVCFTGQDRLIGDMLTLSGSCLSGISLIGLEHAVRFYDATEFLGLVGFFGTIITAVQM